MQLRDSNQQDRQCKSSAPLMTQWKVATKNNSAMQSLVVLSESEDFVCGFFRAKLALAGNGAYMPVFLANSYSNEKAS
jgi:hypothetical protein